MTEELEKQVANKPERDERGRLLPGNTANPNGRPKGKTLKEWMREKLENMTEEEREEFLKDVDKGLRWQMAEGRPHQSSDIEHKLPNNLKEIIEHYEPKGENKE